MRIKHLPSLDLKLHLIHAITRHHRVDRTRKVTVYCVSRGVFKKRMLLAIRGLVFCGGMYFYLELLA